MSHKVAKARYQSIKKRSFETFLDLFLVSTYINDISLLSANEENFAEFNYDDVQIPEALTAYQLGKNSADFKGNPVSELDNVVVDWYKTHDVTSYRSLFGNKLIAEDNFQLFYGPDEINRECHFCKIKESEIETLIRTQKIKTKRLGTRGAKMEIERLKPNEGYVEGNIVFATGATMPKQMNLQQMNLNPLENSLAKS
jgi:hypothetical protein